jgi:hypothetical protein
MRPSLSLLAGLFYVFEVEGSIVDHVYHHHDKHHRHHHHLHKKDTTEETPAPADVETQAKNAKEAASSAKQAADVANQVAVHSIDITSHAQSALKHAKRALHGARVDSSGLSSEQKESLRKAEEKLKAATQKADYGRLSDAKLTGTSAEGSSLDGKLGKLQDKLNENDASGQSDVSSMRSELRSLQEKLAAKRKAAGEGTEVVDTKGTASVEDDVTAEEMEQQLRDLEKMTQEGDFKGASADEVKAEMERLRIGIDRLESREAQAADRERLKKLEVLKSTRAREAEASGKELQRLRSERAALEKELGVAHDADIDKEIVSTRSRLGMEQTEGYGKEYGSLELDVGRKKKVKSDRGDKEEKDVDLDDDKSKSIPGDESTTLSKGSFDIDTEMPYGELEPFGREDTAQELTESSIKESDEMVDQLERAEVAEEKRAVFRALTRLRGAAITSYDGVARSQTGNIDEYNKVHKWRKTHPLHHLADEESDISKWAFPDNADF